MLFGFVAVLNIAISVAILVSPFWPVAVLTIDRVDRQVTGQLADKPTRGQSSRGLVNSLTRYQASLGAPDTSVEFQRVNSRICVAMMVFAPIYVAQMISSYLRDPEKKQGHLGGLKAESDKLRKIRHENQENDSGAPWRMKNELN